VSTGESIELKATGQRLIFRASGVDAVVFESLLPAQRHGLELPADAPQEQRFEVLHGMLGFCIGGAEALVTAGGRVTAPRGIACRYWNPGNEPSHLVAEIRPALDFERYVHANSTRRETRMKLAHAYAKLPVQDVARARAFYRDVLGLDPFREQHGHLSYLVAGVPLLLFPSSGEPSGDHDQLGLVVDDLDTAVAQLNERGVELEVFDAPPGSVVENGVMVRPEMRAAWFKDSEGNLISIAQFSGGSPYASS
jgi:catechol 2,3-dioxygenase-like lactoylglutathione lyase family enzyme